MTTRLPPPDTRRRPTRPGRLADGRSALDALRSNHPEVTAFVDALVSELRALLESELVGIYLSGSLATGGFDRASDVDVVVATRREVRGTGFTTLDTLHRRLARAGTWCATELECTYTSVSALRRFDPRLAVHAHLGRGPGERLELTTFDEGWIVQCHILRTQGITITGSNPVTLIDPVSAGRLRDAMRALVAGWATSFLGNPEALGSRGYQSYVVLSLGRIRYTLEKGRIAGKAEAAKWALQTLDGKWHLLIEQALLDRWNPSGPSSRELVRLTLELIRDTRIAAGLEVPGAGRRSTS